MKKGARSKTTHQSAARRTTRPAPLPNNPYTDQGDIYKEIEDIVADPDQWLRTPNPLFGMRPPIALIGTEDERFVRQWIGAVKHGMMT